ncbi:mechanosensitive ion channel [Rhodobacteraceae bacterium F11138]|nr:mechanosensitive ion channel [Rhodobacteraceae bacterium F11138]
MWHNLVRAGLTFLLATLFSLSADAQSLPGIGGNTKSETTAPESELTQAIRQAAESGVNVVVLDSSGKLIAAASPATATSPDSPPGDNPMEHASHLMRAQAEVQKFRETLSQRLDALPNSLTEVAFILRATSPDGRIMTYAEVLFWTLVLFFFARIAVRMTYGERFAKKLMIARSQDDPQGYRDKMPILVFRFFLGVGGTILMMLVSYIAGYLIFDPVGDSSIELTIAAIYLAVFLSWTVSDLWRMMLSPYLTQYRIPVLSDQDARRLYHWAWIIGSYSIASTIFATWIADFGLNYNVYAILYGLLSLVGAVANVLMVLFNARAISNAIRGGKPAHQVVRLTRIVSYAWAPLMIGYIIFGWFELTFDLVLEHETSVPMIAGAYMVFLSIIIVYGAINYVIERYFDRSRAVARMNQELAANEAADDSDDVPVKPPHALMTYEALARRVAGILAFVAGAYAMLRVWDPENQVLPNSVFGRTLDVITILFIGYVVYHCFRIWIDSKIAEEAVDQEEGELGDEGGASSASRLATLLPLFRGAILAIVVVSIGLIALLELGINVSPLFAGAGVVGLAIGFGAQTLVRDIFSGAFFLVDDAFRKGEYIDIGDVKGTVEKISVRSFQLRHHLGALNTIPFGEIKVLTNYSRDWVIMKLPLRVTYDTDVEKVRKLIKKLGQELLQDPVIGENFIQPLKSQGVIEMQDSAMIIRVKFMTKPGDQWLVRKKVYEEIRALFAREGIHFAHREVTVRLADGAAEDLTEDQKKAVTGAVQGVIEEDQGDPGNGGPDR